MSEMLVHIQKLRDDAILPTQGSSGAAGFDLSMVTASPILGGLEEDSVTIHAGSGHRVFIRTGLAMRIPEGYYGRIAPRSGLAAKHGVDVLAGVIDSDYRGEIVVILTNTGKTAVTLNKGDRVAQMIFEKCGHNVQFKQVKEISESALNADDPVRGSGGFGSTGV